MFPQLKILIIHGVAVKYSLEQSFLGCGCTSHFIMAYLQMVCC